MGYFHAIRFQVGFLYTVHKKKSLRFLGTFALACSYIVVFMGLHGLLVQFAKDIIGNRAIPKIKASG